MIRNFLISIVIISSLSGAVAESAESIGQKADLDALKRSLSSNHALITRFNSQYSELLKKQELLPTDKLKLKLDDLKNKIAVLKNENEHLVFRLSESAKPDAVPTAQPQNLTGKDWLSMNEKDKEMYIFSTMGALVKKDVLTIKPSYYYITSLDKLIAHNAVYEGKSLDDMLILTIYKNEPAARGAISVFRKVEDSELQKIEAP